MPGRRRRLASVAGDEAVGLADDLHAPHGLVTAAAVVRHIYPLPHVAHQDIVGARGGDEASG